MTDPKRDIDRLQQEMDQARTDAAKAGKGDVVKAPKNQSLDGVMPEHPPLGHRDRLAWRDPAEGADLDPLGVDGGHGGFEVTELLLLF